MDNDEFIAGPSMSPISLVPSEEDFIMSFTSFRIEISDSFDGIVYPSGHIRLYPTEPRAGANWIWVGDA